MNNPNMNNPKVSIVVPCWGVEKYLDKCLISLVHQTLKDIEIILVDDESPDSVPKMCDEWLKKDSRIKVIHKKNAGLGMACNSGIEIAKGEYIAFCDSDDWVDVTIVEKLMCKLMNTNADLAVCARYNVKEGKVYKIVTQDLEEVMEVEKNPDVISRVSTSPCAKIYKRFKAYKN